SSFGVLLVGALAPRFMFGALRRAPARYYLESIFAAGLFFAFAAFYTWLLREAFKGGDSELAAIREKLGAAMALFVIGVCPAVFEELAFRGLVHARLQAIFGVRQGWILAATAFGLAHGVGAGLPIHISVGFYLGWLRDRCDSLFP